MPRTFPLSAHIKSARRSIDACVVVGGDLFSVTETSAALQDASRRGVQVRLLFPWHGSSWLGRLAAEAHASTNYAKYVRRASDVAAMTLPDAEMRWYDAPGPCWFVRVDDSTLFTKPFDAVRPTYPVEEDRAPQIVHFGELFQQLWDLSITEPSETWPSAGSERRVEIVAITPLLLQYLGRDPARMRELSADAFELLVADRLKAMGFWVHRTGRINSADGGVDLIAAPERNAPFPFLLAVQVKHSREGAAVQPHVVQALQGAIPAANLDVGLIVTNTRFTEPARMAASRGPVRIRLRDMHDLAGWLLDNFTGEARQTDLPREIHLAPGLRITIPGSRMRQD